MFLCLYENISFCSSETLLVKRWHLRGCSHKPVAKSWPRDMTDPGQLSSSVHMSYLNPGESWPGSEKRPRGRQNVAPGQLRLRFWIKIKRELAPVSRDDFLHSVHMIKCCHGGASHPALKTGSHGYRGWPGAIKNSCEQQFGVWAETHNFRPKAKETRQPWAMAYPGPTHYPGFMWTGPMICHHSFTREIKHEHRVRTIYLMILLTAGLSPAWR